LLTLATLVCVLVIARASHLYLPTLRDDPADAEAASHRLLVRGGYIRQVSAGLWTYLPLGWRVHRKVEQIIREEMNAIGSQEMSAPVLTPAELWQRSDRYSSPEVFKLEDRSGRQYVLPLSHEETFTYHATEIQSYRQLPQMWYHLQTKDRDEPRPKAGLLRVREFVMKDSYSFDRGEEGLDRSYRLHAAAYVRIFERCGLEFYRVQAESGLMGGTESEDFLAPAGAGENLLVTCENGDYAADMDAAQGVPRAPRFPDPLDSPEEIETPGVTTIEGLARFLSIDDAATSKAMPVVTTDGTLVLALVRGDDKLADEKLMGELQSDFRPANDEEIRSAFGAGGGSLGPVGFKGPIVADEMLREGQFVAGANRDGYHLRGVETGRDYEARFADIRETKPDDRCPRCGGALRVQTAIELGHVFKLGTRYSVPLGASYLDEAGAERPIVMGSYGIGPGRVMAAVVEQHHENGSIVWPREVSPYDVHVVALPGADAIAEQAAEALAAAGLDVLLDDRDLRAGEKFADADLIGCPIRVTAGKKSLEDGKVDFRLRSTGEEQRLFVADLGKEVGD
jgi:prolyl-tRNA synthetase